MLGPSATSEFSIVSQTLPFKAYDASAFNAGFGSISSIFETRRTSKIETLTGSVLRNNPGFSVTRDGAWMLWAQVDRHESDLMLVENFR